VLGRKRVVATIVGGASLIAGGAADHDGCCCWRLELRSMVLLGMAEASTAVGVNP
jgi:hypothetical protein